MINRKAFLLNAIEEGFKNDVSGYPLSLKHSKGKNLKDYKIYGNSVQNGTPTPDNPVEIQSVGDKTKNLFDVSKSSGFESQYGGLTNTIDGNVITVECSVPSRIGYLELGTFEAGNYYISANFITGIAYVRVVLNDKIMSSEDYTIRNGKGVVIKVLQDTHIRLSGSFSNNNISKMSDIQMVKSNIPTAYEPYGYKIPVKVSGTNIFDGLLQEGDYGAGANRISSVNYIPVKPNTTYRFSRNNERVYMYDEEKTQLSRVDTGNNGNTITTTEDTRYIRVVWFGTEDTTQTIWINEGTELLDYEPYVAPITTNIYLDEPLRKIGDYADYIDFNNKKIVRKVTFLVIDGFSIYIPSKKSEVCWFSVKKANKHAVDGKVLSPILKSLQESWWQNSEGIISHKINAYGIYLSLNWDRLGLTYDGENVYSNDDINKTTPLSDAVLYDNASKYFTQKFSEGYRTIYYPLDTPTEETIELPNIPTIKGTTILEVDTIVEASNLNVSYKSFEKGE